MGILAHASGVLNQTTRPFISSSSPLAVLTYAQNRRMQENARCASGWVDDNKT